MCVCIFGHAMSKVLKKKIVTLQILACIFLFCSNFKVNTTHKWSLVQYTLCISFFFGLNLKEIIISHNNLQSAHKMPSNRNKKGKRMKDKMQVDEQIFLFSMFVYVTLHRTFKSKYLSFDIVILLIIWFFGHYYYKSSYKNETKKKKPQTIKNDEDYIYGSHSVLE